MEENLNEEEREKLKLENEIRKIKLSLEKGAQFMNDPDAPELPPELENEFLNYIEQFDKMNEDSQTVIIYDKIGRPEFKKVTEIDDELMEYELDKLLDLLMEKSICVEAIYEVDDREFYRFITEELFLHETYDIFMMPGMITHFTYEEFHPNADEDIKRNAQDFVESYFNKENDFYKSTVSSTHTKWFEDFRNVYDDFKLNHFELLDYNHDEMTAIVNFEIDFLAILDDRQTHQYKGKGRMSLLLKEYWLIDKVEFPEVK